MTTAQPLPEGGKVWTPAPKDVAPLTPQRNYLTVRQRSLGVAAGVAGVLISVATIIAIMRVPVTMTAEGTKVEFYDVNDLILPLAASTLIGVALLAVGLGVATTRKKRAVGENIMWYLFSAGAVMGSLTIGLLAWQSSIAAQDLRQWITSQLNVDSSTVIHYGNPNGTATSMSVDTAGTVTLKDGTIIAYKVQWSDSHEPSLVRTGELNILPK